MQSSSSTPPPPPLCSPVGDEHIHDAPSHSLPLPEPLVSCSSPPPVRSAARDASPSSRSASHTPGGQRLLDGTPPPAPTLSSDSHSNTKPASHAVTGSAAPQVIVFDNTKAGLQSVDKEKTEAIIKEMSKNSTYYQNEERKAQNRQRHIERLLVKSRHYEANVRGRRDVMATVEKAVAELEATIETHREFDHIYVHMDMDMFYAAVEMKKNPQYREVPLGIGGIGMLSTTNYIARQYGVRSGMPGFIGLKLCPELVIVPTDFPACRVESDKFKAVVRSYDPTAHGLGMDEIMMCLNDYMAVHCLSANTHKEKYDAAELIVSECRRRVQEATGLTASAGIAPTPTLAKMASNYKKPNGQSSVRLFSREAVMEFLATVPVRQVPGIGKSQESILAGLGIHTLGDIYSERHRLYCILTRKTYEFLLCSALGVGGMYDSTEATADEASAAASAAEAPQDGEWWRKSVGQERTFRKLLTSADLQSIAYRNLRESHATLVDEGLLASQVVLKLKYRTFLVKQHSKSLLVFTDSLEVLQRALDELLAPVLSRFAEFRLLGVRLEKLRQRADGDGVSGATSLPRLATEEEAGQRTLSDFFKAHQASTAATTTGQPRRTGGVTKRPRETDDAGPDSGTEFCLVSSGSQLVDVEELDGQVVQESAAARNSSRSDARNALTKVVAVVDCDDDDDDATSTCTSGKGSGGDEEDDDDVVFVE